MFKLVEQLHEVRGLVASWTRDQWWYFGIFGVLLVLGPVIAYRAGGNVANAIYWLTALVVLAYTVETYGMRREMVRQNELAVQPVIIVLVELRQRSIAPTLAYGPEVFLRNIDRGPALFIRMPDVNLTDPIGEVQFVAHFETPDLLEVGKEAVVKATMTYITQVPGPNPRRLDFVASLNPETAAETYQVAAYYDDIGGQTYESVMQMGKGGITLLRHGKA